jgi:signal transduction histidine kinase
VIKLRLRAIARASAAIAAGDLSQRLVIDGDDEIADLAEQFNDMAARLDANAAELRRLAASAERSRLAGELHDSVNQQIFSISMLAAAINKKLGDHPLAPDVLRLSTLASETHTEMRALIRELRPAALDHHDLSSALKHYVADFGKRYNVTMQVDTQPVGQLSVEVESAFYRIAQEALGNAVRHAFAKHISLKLKRDNEAISLHVEDDGRGFDLSAHSDGLGLHTMRRRAESIGAEYEVKSAPGRGSRVRVRWPVKP